MTCFGFPKSSKPNMKQTDSKKNTLAERPPVVVVMGHIDHGKSTLLDYIRKTKIVDKEAGGITQHVTAYEVMYEAGSADGNASDGVSGKKRRVTFLDTPGHEAFHTLRSRGAKIADVAILVVSVEDGVKPQTLEAMNRIKEQDIPLMSAPGLSIFIYGDHKRNILLHESDQGAGYSVFRRHK